MLLEIPIIKCDCGFGPGWYHTSFDSTHEYNPDVPEEVATAYLQATRDPLGKFFPHISGTHVKALVFDNRKVIAVKRFYYKKYNQTSAAFKAAAEWVIDEIHNSLFRLGA